MHIKRYCVAFPKSAGKYEPPDIGPSEWEKCDQDAYEEETHCSLDQVCGNLAVGCFVPDSLSNRCRMDTKLKNDQQPGGASSPAKPPSIKLRVAIEPFKTRASSFSFQNSPLGHFYAICSSWSWSEASLGETTKISQIIISTQKTWSPFLISHNMHIASLLVIQRKWMAKTIEKWSKITFAGIKQICLAAYQIFCR